jgi:hypothetical protein
MPKERPTVLKCRAEQEIAATTSDLVVSVTINSNTTVSKTTTGIWHCVLKELELATEFALMPKTIIAMEMLSLKDLLPLKSRLLKP